VQEFACREVHESSGDWVVYFASADEMRSFMDVLHRLWLSLQQVSREHMEMDSTGSA
jgi:GH43 family beta-xylosidase